MLKRVLTVFLSLFLCACCVFTQFSCASVEPFTVTFAAGAEDAYLYSGTAVQTVKNSSELSEPIFVRKGYNFAGWSKSLSQIKEDVTVTAQWLEYTFDVTFEDDSGINDSVTKTYSSGIEIEAPEFTKTGYTLSWDTDFATVTASCVIKAVWTANEYKISFYDGEAPLDIEALSVTYDSVVGTLPVLDDKTDGDKTLKHAGWCDEGGNSIVGGMTWVTDKDVKAYAMWTDGKYIITYDLNGGNVINNPYFYSEEDEITLTAPTKTGYVFDGWTGTDIDEKTTTLTIPRGSTGDRHYEATWTPKLYTFKLDPGDGAVSGSNAVTFTFGKKIGELPVAEKEGYAFAGWKCADYTALLTADTVWEVDTVSGKAILTAQYKRKYTVKFSLTTTVIVNKEIKDIECELIRDGSMKLGNFSEFENYTITVLEGESLGYNGFEIFPVVDPIEPKWSDEYSFRNYWKYVCGDGKVHKVLADTVFNQTNFPSVGSDGVIVLRPHVSANWTPAY